MGQIRKGEKASYAKFMKLDTKTRSNISFLVSVIDKIKCGGARSKGGKLKVGRVLAVQIDDVFQKAGKKNTTKVFSIIGVSCATYSKAIKRVYKDGLSLHVNGQGVISSFTISNSLILGAQAYNKIRGKL